MQPTKSFFSKDYIVAVLAGGIFLIVNFVTLSFAPAYLVSYGYSDFMAGFQNTLFSLFCVFFRFYFAPLADIKGRKQMLKLGMLAFVAGMFLFYFSRGSFFVVVLGRLCMGVGMASCLSSASCYVSEIVPTHKQGLAIGIQRAIYSISLLVGPLGAIRIINGPFGYRGLFLTLLVFSILGFVLLLFIRESYVSHETRVDMKKILAEYVSLVSQKKTRHIYARLLPVTISYGAVLSYVTIYLAKFPVIENAGVFFTFFAIAGFLGNIVGGYSLDRFSHETLSKRYASVHALGVMLLFFVPQFPVPSMILAGTIAGFGFTSSIAVTINWLVVTVPEYMKGTALGLQESCIDGGISLGSLLFGMMTVLLPQQTIYLILGLLALAIPYLLGGRGLGPSIKQEQEERNAISNHPRNV